MSEKALTVIETGPVLDQRTVDEVWHLISTGDLSKMTPQARTGYYSQVCKSLGLNPATRPFDFLRLNGKEVMYARKDATQQLARIYGMSIEAIDRKEVGGIYIVEVRASDRSGRSITEVGAVPFEGLKGEARANAMMKAETKAKRRAVLALCGLGFLDESEIQGEMAEAAPPPKAPILETIKARVAKHSDQTTEIPAHDATTGEIIDAEAEPIPQPANDAAAKAAYKRILAAINGATADSIAGLMLAEREAIDALPQGGQDALFIAAERHGWTGYVAQAAAE